MTVRGGWRKSRPIRNWRSTPEKDLALQLLLDSFLASFLVGNCPLPGHQQTDLCGNEVLLESWGHFSQEGKHWGGINVEAGEGQGCLKTEGNLVKLLPEHLHSETTGVSGLVW